ncbi:MAG: hypothetical protein R2726_07945 [Acidimicrobiales bacterium]
MPTCLPGGPIEHRVDDASPGEPAMARKKDQPPDPMSLPPRWRVPDQCPHCGARVEQAVQSRADQPACKFCNEPLPCEALPPPAPAPTGFEGLMGGIVQGAMNNAMAQQQAMAQQWMDRMSQPGALAAMSDPFQHGRGTVKTAKDLGSDTAEGHLYLVDLDVALPGWHPYTASVSTAVPSDAAGKLSPGTQVAVRVHPGSPQDVKVDWRAP